MVPTAALVRTCCCQVQSLDEYKQCDVSIEAANPLEYQQRLHENISRQVSDAHVSTLSDVHCIHHGVLYLSRSCSRDAHALLRRGCMRLLLSSDHRRMHFDMKTVCVCVCVSACIAVSCQERPQKEKDMDEPHNEALLRAFYRRYQYASFCFLPVFGR